MGGASRGSCASRGPVIDCRVADAWLKSFNDPTLDALVAEAIADNRDLAQAA